MGSDRTPPDAALCALANGVKRERHRLGLSQRDLATRSGLRRELIGQIERAEGNPSFTKVITLAHGLGLAPDEIGRLLVEP